MLRRFGEAPPLGSEKDFVLRQYVEREIHKESIHTRLLVTASLGLSDKNRQTFLSDYRKYTSLSFFKDFEEVAEEAEMREKLDEILTTRPKLTVRKDGTVVVTDLFTKVEDQPKPPVPTRVRPRQR